MIKVKLLLKVRPHGYYDQYKVMICECGLPQIICPASLRPDHRYIVPDMDWNDNDEEDRELTFWDVLGELQGTINTKSLVTY